MGKLKKFDYFVTTLVCLPAVLVFVFFSLEVIKNRGDFSRVFIFNHKIVVTVTGSMEPEIMTNSLGIIRRLDYSEFKLGDIVVFDSPTNPGQIIVHRIVGITSRGFKTRGDANQFDDEWVVNADNIHGIFIKAFNSSVPIMSYLFPSYPEPNIGAILFFALIVSCVLGFICHVINLIYSLISISLFIRLNGEQDSYFELFWWYEECLSEQELKKLFDINSSSKTLLFTYRRARLVSLLNSEYQQVKKIRRLYEKTRCI